MEIAKVSFNVFLKYLLEYILYIIYDCFWNKYFISQYIIILNYN